MITFKSYAKINLYLHVTGKRPNGFHELDSAVCFAGFGDEITIFPADDFDFEVGGEFAHIFSKNELKSDRTSKNIAVRAVWNICDRLSIKPDFKLRLIKNLPLSAGIGGGSSNAATVLRAICQYKNIDINSPIIMSVARELGADVPVCMDIRAKLIRGTGHEESNIIELPSLALLLVKPAGGCSTAEVFKRFRGNYKAVKNLPDSLVNRDVLIKFLLDCENDLCKPAVETCEEIQDVLDIINSCGKPLICRMSGSGSCCFAIYKTMAEAKHYEQIIKEQYPDLWVIATSSYSES